MLSKEPYIALGIFGEVCGRVTAIACSTYTTFAVTDAFTAQNKSEEDSKDFLASIFFVANILAFTFSLIFGSASQYFKVTSLILLTNGIMLVASIFMVYDLDNIGVIFTISYCIVASMNTSNFVLS